MGSSSKKFLEGGRDKQAAIDVARFMGEGYLLVVPNVKGWKAQLVKDEIQILVCWDLVEILMKKPYRNYLKQVPIIGKIEDMQSRWYTILKEGD